MTVCLGHKCCEFTRFRWSTAATAPDNGRHGHFETGGQGRGFTDVWARSGTRPDQEPSHRLGRGICYVSKDITTLDIIHRVLILVEASGNY